MLAPERSWALKFHDAFRGVKAGVRGQSSFFVHFFFAAAVIASGVILLVSWIDWCLLLLCITVVMTAEMFNSAMEALAKLITDEYNEHINKFLDIGSGAVLVASIGAALVGAMVFLHRIVELLGWLAK
jgi:diacylglycerol kinase